MLRPVDRGPPLLFLEDFLDDVDLQVTFGKQTLEPRIFFFEITDAGGFARVHAAKAIAPAVEAIFGNIVLTADFGDSLFASLSLLQDGDDLLIGKLVLLHSSILPFGSILTMPVVQFLGERSFVLLILFRSASTERMTNRKSVAKASAILLVLGFCLNTGTLITCLMLGENLNINNRIYRLKWEPEIASILLFYLFVASSEALVFSVVTHAFLRRKHNVLTSQGFQELVGSTSMFPFRILSIAILIAFGTWLAIWVPYF